MLQNIFHVIYQTRETVFHWDIQRVENMTHCGVYLTKCEVFGWAMKHCCECLIYLLNQNKN